MTRQKSDRVIPRRRCRIRPVAVEAVGARVTGGAGRRRRRRDRPVAVGEVTAMRRGPAALDRRPGASAWSRSVHCHRHRGLRDVAREAALLGVAGGAGPWRPACGLPVATHEYLRRMVWRRLELGPNGQRAGIDREGLNGGEFGRIDVAADAELARVAGGAGPRHRVVALEARRPVQGRGRKAADPLDGEARGLRQGQVARGACRVGRRQVRCRDPVAREALPDVRATHLHPSTAAGEVTRSAGHRIGREPPRRTLGVPAMTEPQVRCGRGSWRMPVHCPFDLSIVTGGAVAGRRPEGSGRVAHACMAALARREQPAVLPVVEAVRGHPGAERAARPDERQERDRESSEPHGAARRTPRIAGGSR